MDLKVLEKLSATPGAEMPDGLGLGEELLFLTLRELYNNFRSGAVNRERGKREKQRIMVAYQSIQFQESLMDYHMKLRRRLEREVGSLHMCGCETCRKVARVFDGIERNDPPEDVAELQTRNDRLRDLVKERSERAGQLATQLDQVRWALDEKIPPEEMIEKIRKVVEK